EQATIGEFELSLTQEIEWAGQRRLRIRGAQRGLERAEAVVLDSARRTLSDVSTSFYEALAAEQRLAVAREMAQLNEQLVSVTRIQSREGEISVMDANLAEIEAGRARAAVRGAERELTSALLEFRRRIGLAPDQPIRLADEVVDAPAPLALSVDSLTSIALTRRPDLTARQREREQQEALVRAAQREAIPNLR